MTNKTNTNTGYNSNGRPLAGLDAQRAREAAMLAKDEAYRAAAARRAADLAAEIAALSTYSPGRRFASRYGAIVDTRWGWIAMAPVAVRS